jgi:cytochrome P450
MTSTLEEPPYYPMARRWFDPPIDLERIQTAERVVRVRLWDDSTPWIITGYDEVRAILADPRVSDDSDLPGYPHFSAGMAARKRATKTLNNMDNPEHDHLRRLVTREFSVKRVEALRPTIQRLVDELIDDMIAGPKPMDLVEAFALPLPTKVICEMLGVPYEDRDVFGAIVERMTSSASSAEAVSEASEQMRDFMGSLLEDKAKDARPTDDIMSRLAVEQLRPGLRTRDELTNLCITLLVAGHDTTKNMIGLGTAALLQHPDVLNEIQSTDDLTLVAKAVEELLRWLNILHLGRRRSALEDIEIAGKLIKAGDGIVIAHDVANRDPEVFPNPDALDIHRDARQHVAFGYGIHQCLGQQLARIELQVVYGTLYRRLPNLALAVPFESLHFKDDAFVYGVEALPVTW